MRVAADDHVNFPIEALGMMSAIGPDEPGALVVEEKASHVRPPS